MFSRIEKVMEGFKLDFGNLKVDSYENFRIGHWWRKYKSSLNRI